MTLHPSQFEYHSRVQFQSGVASWLLILSGWGLLTLACFAKSPPFKAATFGGALLVGAATRPIRRIAIDTERLTHDVDDISHTSLQRWLFERMKPDQGVTASTPVNIGDANIEPVADLPAYDLSEAGQAHHTMIVGPTGSGKSVLVQWLVQRYFTGADVRVYDSDAAPEDWPGFPVIGRGGDFVSISGAMVEDLKLLDRRCEQRSQGKAITTEAVRVCEEFPAVAAELTELLNGKKDSSAANWLKRIARRGRKYKIKLILVTQETTVAAMGIEGEGGVRKAFTIIYLGSAALEVASTIKDAELRSAFLQRFQQCDRPCLVNHRGRWYATEIPDLQGNFHPTSTPAKAEVNFPSTSTPGKSGKLIQLADFRTSTPTPEVTSDDGLFQAISALLDAGKSKSWIVENILGYKGRKFSEGMQRLDELLKR